MNPRSSKHAEDVKKSNYSINPLNVELNPIRHLLALVGARHIVHVSRVRVNMKKSSFLWFMLKNCIKIKGAINIKFIKILTLYCVNIVKLINNERVCVRACIR